MYTGLQHLHSLNRYIILVLLIAVLYTSFTKWKGNKPYTKADNKLNLFTFISAHIQLTIGLVLYFWNKSGLVNFDNISVKIYRFFTIEHIFGMLVAIALITICRIKVKKLSDDTKKHKQTFVYYIVAILIILATIPWPFRNVGVNSWF